MITSPKLSGFRATGCGRDLSGVKAVFRSRKIHDQRRALRTWLDGKYRPRRLFLASAFLINCLRPLLNYLIQRRGWFIPINKIGLILNKAHERCYSLLFAPRKGTSVTTINALEYWLLPTKVLLWASGFVDRPRTFFQWLLDHIKCGNPLEWTLKKLC